jgi:hypothetical protein
MAMYICTDGIWHHFCYGYDIPPAVLEDYNWLTEDEKFDQWIAIEYGQDENKRTEYRHLSDFMRCDKGGEFDRLGWQGYIADSAFHGILLRVSDDSELYKIGKVFS